MALAELPGPGMLRSRGSARSTVGTIGLDRCGADGYHELDTQMGTRSLPQAWYRTARELNEHTASSP